MRARLLGYMLLAVLVPSCGPILDPQAIDAHGKDGSIPAADAETATTPTPNPTPVTVTTVDSNTTTGSTTTSQPTDGNTTNPNSTTPVLDITQGLLTSAGLTTVVAGSSFPVHITALDPNNQINTNFNGVVSLVVSDPNAKVPAPVQAVNGIATFQGVILTTAGQVSLHGSTETLQAPIVYVQVKPSSMSALTITMPATIVWNANAANITVSAFDTYGNLATDFLGQVSFPANTSPGQLESALPAPYTFQALDHGSKVFLNGFQLPASYPGQIYTVEVASGSVTASTTITVTQQ